MDDRIQRALDGELRRDELTPAELAELDESTDLLSGVLRSIPTQTLPKVGTAVLQRIDALEGRAASPANETVAPYHSTGLIHRLWTPAHISFAMRPAYLIGVAAIVAIVIGFGFTEIRNGATERRAVATGSEPQGVLVHFRFEAPGARTVSLAGDFSNWSPKFSLTPSESGVWTIVVPLKPGVHDYSFIVDGEKWVPDPDAPATADGFGGMNSRIAVLAPDARRSL